MVLEVLRALGSDNFINLATDVRDGLNDNSYCDFCRTSFWVTDYSNHHLAFKLRLDFSWPLIFLIVVINYKQGAHSIKVIFIFASYINFFSILHFHPTGRKICPGSWQPTLCVLLPRRPVRRVAGRLPWRPHSRGFPPAPERGGGHQCGHPHLIHILQRWERRARRQVKENSLSTLFILFFAVIFFWKFFQSVVTSYIRGETGSIWLHYRYTDKLTYLYL